MNDGKVSLEFLGEQMARMQTDIRDLKADHVGKADLRALGDRLEVRIDQVDAKVDRVDAKVDRVDAKVDSLAGNVVARFDNLERSIDARFDQVNETMATNLDLVLKAIEAKRS